MSVRSVLMTAKAAAIPYHLCAVAASVVDVTYESTPDFSFRCNLEDDRTDDISEASQVHFTMLKNDKTGHIFFTLRY